MPERVTKAGYFVGLLLSTVVLVLLLVVCIIANVPAARRIGTKVTVGEVSDEFNTYFTPIDATFAIWYLVFGWQVVWVAYAWTFVFKSRPVMISPKALQFYSFANLFAIVWLVLWINRIPQFTFPPIAIFTLLLYLAVALQAIYIYENTYTWRNSETILKFDLIFARFLVLNGIMIYAVWATVATLLNFTVVIEYFSNASKTNAGIISLTIFLLLFLGYFNLENVVLDSWLRYIITVYPVIIWALYGIVRKLSFEFLELTGIAGYATFCLSLVVFLQGVRLALIAVFSYKRPIKYPDPASSQASQMTNINIGPSAVVAPAPAPPPARPQPLDQQLEHQLVQSEIPPSSTAIPMEQSKLVSPSSSKQPIDKSPSRPLDEPKRSKPPKRVIPLEKPGVLPPVIGPKPALLQTAVRGPGEDPPSTDKRQPSSSSSLAEQIVEVEYIET